MEFEIIKEEDITKDNVDDYIRQQKWRFGQKVFFWSGKPLEALKEFSEETGFITDDPRNNFPNEFVLFGVKHYVKKDAGLS